jgi:hypothetical protein
MVKALPGSSLEAIKTEFQVLVGLLANLSRLDGSRQDAQVVFAGRLANISSLPTSCVHR